MFLIFSYVDTAAIVCYQTLLLLNKRFNALTRAKDQEAINLFKKQDLKIKISCPDDFIKVERVNLLYFNFGFELKAVHFTILLTKLKPYPNPKVLSFIHGLVIDGSKPSRSNKLID